MRERERKCILENIPASSRSQIKEKIKAFFLSTLYSIRESEAYCDSALYQLGLNQLNMGSFSLDKRQYDNHRSKSRWLNFAVDEGKPHMNKCT